MTGTINILEMSPSVAATTAWGTMLAQGLAFDKRVFFRRSASLLGVYIGVSFTVAIGRGIVQAYREAGPGRHAPD